MLDWLGDLIVVYKQTETAFGGAESVQGAFSVMQFILAVISVFAAFIALHFSQRQHDNIRKHDLALLRKQELYAYRRTWNGSEMIAARIRANSCKEELLQSLPVPPGQWLDAHPSYKWEDFAFIAHFMGDIELERKNDQITDREIIESFAEFPDWAAVLIPLYSTDKEEERLVAQMSQLKAIFEPAPLSTIKVSRRDLFFLPRRPLGERPAI